MKKLLHISLGSHNTNMWQAFNNNFITTHYDWTLKQNSIKALNYDILQLNENIKPDICFFQLQKGGLVTPNTIKKLSKNSITILWNGDVRMPIPKWEVELGRVFDISLFTNNNYIVELTKKRVNAHFLQVGFDPTIFKPKGPRTNTPQIVFCGSNYMHITNFPLSNLREQMVSLLHQKYNDNFGVFGNGWSNIATERGYLNLQDEASAYRSSLIGINLSHFNYGRYTSDRLLRMMGSGCFVLSHNYIDIKKDFKPGKHLDTFTDLNNLTEKIDYYLKNAEKRNKIALKGAELVHNTYTWNHFCIALKKIIGC